MRPRFRHADGGATAVEFALIAPFFFGLIFGILEVALTFWSSQVLETAVTNAARLVYTGGFQSNGANAVAATALINFKKNVCDNVGAVFNCNKLVSVDIQKFNSFNQTSLTLPISNGRYDTSNYGYNPPGSNQIGVVRASMEYPVIVNVLHYGTGLASGNRLIIASATFRTEPY